MTTFDARPQAAIGSRPPGWLSSVLVDGHAGEFDAVFPFHQRIEPSCVATARRFVDQTLTAWGVMEVAFDAQLVVSELVTNAMRHGGGVAQLRLLSHGAELACVVADHSHTVPVTAAPDVFSEFGRGLRLVDALCSAWGWLSPSGSRKLVWAVLVG
ncbi:ATP-binding protein [Nonomuraea diastatica]|uniref:ATP-binding protein n=1 Tax=Nonomuraea diastatica TaxID=1848329 RepID=A0A4R4VV15_9ACTN|nr:ATP-binding protein [Nonomuraea diastatica]TDD09909.1 ATP-binding protein [Nonomuraea diastatica]